MDLAAYLPYFKKMINRQIRWTTRRPEDGLIRAGYPLYDQEMIQFAHDYKISPFFDRHYRRTLRSAGIKPRLNHATVGDVIMENNPVVTQAMLSLIIDEEDMQQGLWAQSLQEGYLYRLVKSLESSMVAA